jgi:hypothetical protein
MTRRNLTAPATGAPSTRSPICRGRKFTLLDQNLADRQSEGMVQIKNVDGNAALRGKRRKPRAVPPEMLGPDVGPGVKEGDDFPAGRIDSRDIWPFAKVAFETTQREVVECGLSAVLPRNGMINLEPSTPIALLRVAILAKLLGTLFHAMTKRLGHHFSAGGVCSLASMTFGPWIEEKREDSRR